MSKSLPLKKIVMVGFGTIGQAVLPLLFKEFDLSPERVIIISPESEGNAASHQFQLTPLVHALTPGNYRQILMEHIKAGDILLNLSVDVSSVALIELCQEMGALYLDTCIEPWAGAYYDTSLSVSARSNYALRESALKLKAQFPNGPTALLAHGANPGLVSHFVKRALMNIAQDLGKTIEKPKLKQGWAQLASILGVKVIHIAEQDTQKSSQPRNRDAFTNTWSVEGFLSEGAQPAELGWGSHEKHFPVDGQRHEHGCQAAIFINKPGLCTRVRTWAPLAGPMQGILITHNEAISIADYLTVKENGTGTVLYRPTVHYSYQPCDDALLSIHDLLGNNMQKPKMQKVLMDDITQGMDELGVLLMGHNKGAYWYGSQLSIDEARTLAPFNNATSLQVAAGVLGALACILKYPKLGVVEPEDIDGEYVIEIASKYLGTLVGAYTDWTPLANRSTLFPENIDTQDPWQFVNFRLN